MSILEQLGDDQEGLLYHLGRFNILDYPSCLRVLDTEKTGDMVAISYRFRPLSRYGYVKKDKDGVVSITALGRDAVWQHTPLISVGGGETTRKRILQVSRTAALLESAGIYSYGEVMEEVKEPYFIPSACWRRLADGILSTTRFVGMVMLGGQIFALYDIGDGHMEWQMRAETSLFHHNYRDGFDPGADGMIFLCDEDKRVEVAQNIIRQTMWSRKQLLRDCTTDRTKPVKWSNSPIKLKAKYEHVYLTTPKNIRRDLERILGLEHETDILIQKFGGKRKNDKKYGDIESYPLRLFANPATDLLKYVYFFSQVKSSLKYPGPVTYAMAVWLEDRPIMTMYPDVTAAAVAKKEARFYYYYTTENNSGN